ncbi:Ctf8-domain-containing protein [Trametes maxima]|nr:Ctf8-domain-containing protein [Trametes maxima]
MIISITVPVPGPSSSPDRKLPPQLVHFGTDELVLVELQGALEVEGSKDSQLVGKLRVDPETKKPTLLIGHHLLEGKLMNLPKPLAVLHRKDHGSPSSEDAMVVDNDDPEYERPKLEATKSWDIVAVVKRKMVFSKRPMPMVGKTSSTAPVSRTGSKV